MSREITDHKLNGLNDSLRIERADDVAVDNAYHKYDLAFFHHGQWQKTSQIAFQKGPLGEVGPNGISNEALLAIVIDRLRCFQSGKFSCRENAIALTHCEDALHWLQHRTRDRMKRGVEGTMET